MTTANQEIKDLKNEVHHLAELVEKSVKNAGNGASNVIGISRKDMRNAARKAGKNVRSFLHDKSEQATEMYHKAEDTIVERPITSVAAAGAIGLLLGALLKRK